MMTPGARAERRAERFLRRQGYRTLARNLRVGRDELDLVMRTPDGSTIVLVEVKSSVLGMIRARGALDHRKRRRVARALRGLERLGLLVDHAVRVDAILVDTSGPRPMVEHLPGRSLPPSGARGQPCQ
jgi:putative endonuclease